jgi:GT2 family glycosyltransferase/glycosyltransferase involved in cell wall biosynthesis
MARASGTCHALTGAAPYGSVRAHEVCAVTVTYGQRAHQVSRVARAALAEDVGRLVIVANGVEAQSLETLRTLAAGDARIRLVERPVNRGSADGFGRGIDRALAWAPARAVWLLDDDNLPTPDSLNALLESEAWREADDGLTAVLSFRPGLGYLRRAMAGSDPFPRPSSFLDFDARRHLPGHPSRRRSRNAGRPSFPYAPYGGLLLGRELVTRIGTPDTRFVLYADDLEYTSRILAAGGRIAMVPDSRVEDICAPGLVAGETSRTAPKWMWFGIGEDWRAYYAMRNKVFLDATRSRSRTLFAANALTVLTWLAVLGIATGRLGRLLVLGRAVSDGLSGRLGQRYPLGPAGPEPGPGRQTRILVVSVFPPNGEADHGGGRVLAWNVAELAEHSEVALVFLDPEGTPGRALPVDTAFVRAVRPPSSVARRLAVAWGLLRGRPRFVSGARSRRMRRAVGRAIDSWHPDVVQFEHTAAAQYAADMKPTSGCARPVRVLVDYDPREAAARADAAAARRRTPWARAELRAWRAWEARAPRLVDAVITFTDADRAVVTARVPGTPVVAIPAASPGRSAEPAPAKAVDPHLVLFVGSFAHAPNVDAARRLAGGIFPRIRSEVPLARLEIVGPGDPTVRSDTANGVHVRGWVPDLAQARARAAVEVAPLRFGGGVRVKVLEALAGGSAVVATPRAIEGIDVVDGRDLIVADDDEQIAQAVIGLLRDPQRRRALESAARRWSSGVDGAGRWRMLTAVYRPVGDSGRPEDGSPDEEMRPADVPPELVGEE